MQYYCFSRLLPIAACQVDLQCMLILQYNLEIL